MFQTFEEKELCADLETKVIFYSFLPFPSGVKQLCSFFFFIPFKTWQAVSKKQTVTICCRIKLKGYNLGALLD